MQIDTQLLVIAAGFISIPIVLFLMRRIFKIPKLLKVGVMIMVVAGLLAVFLIGILDNIISKIH